MTPMVNAAEIHEPSIIVRQIPFEFPDDICAHWNPANPEWSHMVNGASLTMPYLEPYLIKCVRMALDRIEDPQLQADARAYVAQEGQHYRQHRRFNDLLIAQGYNELPDIEQQMQREYDAFLEKRSLKFNLAYTAGFETMALSIGHWLSDEREHLFGGSDPRVASFILWHFVEEIEHKNVALDVYRAVYGGNVWRIFGLFAATGHVVYHTRKAYRSMMKHDGTWTSFSARLRLWRMVGGFLRRVIPHLAHCCLPSHDPRNVSDPAWMVQWIKAYSAESDTVPILDTNNLGADLA